MACWGILSVYQDACPGRETCNHYAWRPADQRRAQADRVELIPGQVIDDCLVDDVPDEVLNRYLDDPDDVRI